MKPKRPSLASTYRYPLPLDAHPLPTFIPHNPLSYLHLLYFIARAYLSPPTSHATIYSGYWSPLTRSVHITNHAHARALWERGFFGKGSLSRSEPTWLDQERNHQQLLAAAAAAAAVATAEEFTQLRRTQRDTYKADRALAQIARVEQQLLLEKEGVAHLVSEEQKVQPVSVRAAVTMAAAERQGSRRAAAYVAPADADTGDIADQEHLQLSPQEALFLCYGLGVLNVVNGETGPLLDCDSLFSLCRRSSYFPTLPVTARLPPDDPFLVNHVVYHHYRSLGWVVRDGIKFAVDYLLYDRGPAFKHAAFSLVIIPSYTDAAKQSQPDWAWLHRVNRVQSQVFKTLILVYVDIPPPSSLHNIASILASYNIREVCVSRYSPNRQRD